jgi:hypothetical protein
VYACCDNSKATLVRDNDEVLDALQMSPRDHAAWAATLLWRAEPRKGPGATPTKRGYRLLQSETKDADPAADLMHGVTIALGEARRKVESAAKDEALTKALAVKRQLLAEAVTVADLNDFQAKLLSTITKLPDDQGALTLAAISHDLRERGKWDQAHAIALLLADIYPAHPVAASTYRWLIHHDGSAEVRHRYERNQFTPRGRLADAKTKSAAAAKDWCQCSIDHGKKLAGFGPLYAADPRTMFPLQAARRGTGDPKGPAEWFDKFQTYVKDGPWHDAAQAESWLAGRTKEPPKQFARCRLTDVRPYLDGEFDDRCWQAMKPITLDNAVGDTAKQYMTQAAFAYDQEFLYIALKCSHPKGKQVAPVKVRPRDADVEPFDRVSILLDIDRDYATYYRLEIDQRGCVREDCWGDVSWNPKWFVAIKSTDEAWQIEAAIPVGELTGERIAVNSAWAFNVVRILPGQGVQSWSQPADVQPRPEGMSLLIFQQDPQRAAAAPMAPAQP